MNSHQRKKAQKARFAERQRRISADEYDNLFWSPQYIKEMGCQWVDFGFLSKKYPHVYYFCCMSTTKYTFSEMINDLAVDIAYEKYPISNSEFEFEKIKDPATGEIFYRLKNEDASTRKATQDARSIMIDNERDRILSTDENFVQEKMERMNHTFKRVSKTGKVTVAGGYEPGVIGLNIVVDKPFIDVQEIKEFIEKFRELDEPESWKCDTIIKYSKEELENFSSFCVNALK